VGGRDIRADAPRPDPRRPPRRQPDLAAGVPDQRPPRAIALFAAIRHVEESRDPDATGHFDWFGSAVGALAVGGLAFGGIHGQESHWSDPLAWISLAVGAVCLVLFPILMAIRPHPLVPLSLFRNREFASINLATFLIYGALYVSFSYTSLLFQGRSATPRPARPSSVSRRRAAGRALGAVRDADRAVWRATLPGRRAADRHCRLPLAGADPVDSEPWLADLASPSTWIPPTRRDRRRPAVHDRLRARMAMVVAPLTSTLMNSIPSRNSGLGSAINNALSRVGQPLLGAVIFVAITASFYAELGRLVPVSTRTIPTVQAAVQPLNPPAPGRRRSWPRPRRRRRSTPSTLPRSSRPG
jgi:hypothetical protein